MRLKINDKRDGIIYYPYELNIIKELIIFYKYEFNKNDLIIDNNIDNIITATKLFNKYFNDCGIKVTIITDEEYHLSFIRNFEFPESDIGIILN